MVLSEVVREIKVSVVLVLSEVVRENLFCPLLTSAAETDGPQRPTHEDCSLGAVLLRYATGTAAESPWGPGRTSLGGYLEWGAR